MILASLLPILLAAALDAPAASPVFPARATKGDVPALLQSTAFVRGLDDAALLRLVPEQSGLHYIGCPNCTNGHQENQLTWTPERPDEVSCRYCDHRYPSQKYPMDRTLTVRNPRGDTQRYPYWQDTRGYRYFFKARRDALVREYLADRAVDLGQLYAATGDKAHARRAALLIDRFAQVFPGWCYHYDYPFRQKVVEDGDVPPSKFRPGFRTARWTWWAYMDIPLPLVQAYDWIRGSGVLEELSRVQGTDVAARIERDLFRNAAEQVLANRDDSSNMDPTAWRSLVITGRVLGEPRYVHEVTAQMRHLMLTRFYYDGSWSEGAPSYASQTVGGVSTVLGVLRGYSDPKGYHAPDGSRFDNLDLSAEIPQLDDAQNALARMRLPSGRLVPVHDTWRSDRARGRRRRGGFGAGPGDAPAPSAAASTQPFLLPALGHACLGGGSGSRQTQVHLTWSGGYGHQHGDNLSLLLFANGQELLTDLGYSHTRYRSWTLATAAHNTVVIDGKSQDFGSRDDPTDGSLRIYDAGDRRVQVVSADGERAYPGLAKTYRRTLVVVDAGENRQYTVDCFQVEGGRVHDYFLHGDIDTPTSGSSELALEPMATLLPPGFVWKPTENEGEASRAREPNYAYGFLRGLKAAGAPAGTDLPVVFRPSSEAGPALKVHLLPEPGTRLVLGEDPSISPAGEDDARLEQFFRPFALLRHEADTGRSTFAAVIEPKAGSAGIQSVERLEAQGATLALRVRMDDREDFIVIDASRPVRLDAGSTPATFEGAVGFLSVRAGQVEHAYAIGRGGWTRGTFTLQSQGTQTLELRQVEDHVLVLAASADVPPRPGDVVRVVTADGWVYPYTVAALETKEGPTRLRVVENTAMQLDVEARTLSLTAFPQRTHRGAVRVEWSPRASR